MKYAIFTLVVLAAALGMAAFDAPTPAKELLSKAQVKAERESKALFVVFDASW